MTDSYEEYQEFLLALEGNQASYEHIYGGKKPRLEDVAAAMRNKPPPPEMIVADWLVAAELHWVFADAEAGKTFLALKLSIDVINAGGTVVYFDEELGVITIAERLLALGADPDVVATRFYYAPFPSWQMTEEDATAHREFIEALKPKLVVYDTATDAFAEANIDENSGIQVTRWVKAYPEQARRVGATQLVLDHTGHAETGRAVGSRAKKAKAKVQYKLRATKRFDRDLLGEVKVTLAKNTRGARLPHARTFTVGGYVDESGEHFVWTEQETPSTEATLMQRIMDYLPIDEAEAKSVTDIKRDVTGDSADIGNALKKMKNVNSKQVGRSTRYWK